MSDPTPYRSNGWVPTTGICLWKPGSPGWTLGRGDRLWVRRPPQLSSSQETVMGDPPKNSEVTYEGNFTSDIADDAPKSVRDVLGRMPSDKNIDHSAEYAWWRQQMDYKIYRRLWVYSSDGARWHIVLSAEGQPGVSLDEVAYPIGHYHIADDEARELCLAKVRLLGA